MSQMNRFIPAATATRAGGPPRPPPSSSSSAAAGRFSRAPLGLGRSGERCDRSALRVEDLDRDLVGRRLQVVVDRYAARDRPHRRRPDRTARRARSSSRGRSGAARRCCPSRRTTGRASPIDQVVVLDLDAVHRRHRQAVLERLPRRAVVERDVDAGFRAEEQQALPLGIFADRTREIVGWQAADDLRPRLAVVARLVDVRRAVGLADSGCRRGTRCRRRAATRRSG